MWLNWSCVVFCTTVGLARQLRGEEGDSEMREKGRPKGAVCDEREAVGCRTGASKGCLHDFISTPSRYV